MKKLFLPFLFFAGFMLAAVSTTNAQPSNYTEDDIVMMKSQQNVCENIMKLLEEKMVDSALHYFKDKSAATKKNLTTISNAIQKYKGTYTFEVSPDLPNSKELHYYCKYTAEEGTKIMYRVDYIFDRTDKTFKVKKIVMK